MSHDPQSECINCGRPMKWCQCVHTIHLPVDKGIPGNQTTEIYEGDLILTAHQAMEVLSRKVGLQYAAGEGNELYLQHVADAMLTTLKKHNSTTDIVVRRK